MRIGLSELFLGVRHGEVMHWVRLGIDLGRIGLN
jgi:hypothetical protein